MSAPAGVNDYAPRPQIDTPCIWTDPDTNASIVLVMTEQGQGYPDNVGPDPTNPGETRWRHHMRCIRKALTTPVSLLLSVVLHRALASPTTMCLHQLSHPAGGLGAPYCVSSNFSAAVLCFAFRTDNSGPPESVAEVLNQFDIARWWVMMPAGCGIVLYCFRERWMLVSCSSCPLPLEYRF